MPIRHYRLQVAEIKKDPHGSFILFPLMGRKEIDMDKAIKGDGKILIKHPKARLCKNGSMSITGAGGIRILGITPKDFYPAVSKGRAYIGRTAEGDTRYYISLDDYDSIFIKLGKKEGLR
jgi:hypothetical protein